MKNGGEERRKEPEWGEKGFEKSEEGRRFPSADSLASLSFFEKRVTLTQRG